MPLFLHLLDPWSISPDEARSGLSRAERAQADRFVFQQDAERWSAFRTLTRRILAGYLPHASEPIEWAQGEHGKPFVRGAALHFNLSHADSLGLLAVSDLGPVGVDLEPSARGLDLIGCEEAFCHPEEIAGAEGLEGARRGNYLMHIWTAKEAALKCLGTGLSHPPQEVRISGHRAFGALEGLAALHIGRPSHERLAGHLSAWAAHRDIREIQWA
ncbi:4'-phosphopantetheinyl transferase family protein [Haloferula sargassicola]|uniref:4'-phosphopantetheinyl transferase n=1 Tax=Haloferula sargassicola TaxID=490096 RepID=A0ABP9UT87_9BACT